jgi:TolB-like protein/cytochrome c-type biogenesis protein CcmH/NrfG
MKHCPQCKRVETDEALKFCRVDGATLVNDSSSIDQEAGTAKLGEGQVASATATRILPLATEASFNRVTAPTTVLSTQPPNLPAVAFKARRRKATIAIIVAAAAVVVACSVVFFKFYFSTRRTATIQSIAVLPFENASGNAELEYLSDGVSENVIDSLSELPQLKVIARSSSFRYRGPNLDFKEIANALGVDAIVTGRVVQRGDTYQIRIEMVDARDNRNLWSESFNGKASDVQVLQANISREIAGNLLLKLSRTETQTSPKQTANPQAYQLVLKGNFYRNNGSTEDLNKSIECFLQAISIDPSYASAYAGLADAYRFVGGDPKEMLAKREAAIRRALELDDTLADAHFSMGQYQRDLWNWEEAEREYRRAMQLNPNSAHAYSGLSGLLSLLGRYDEAIVADKRAMQLDPVGVIVNTVAGRTLHYARRYDEAIEQLKKTIEFDSSSPTPHIRLADVYVTKKMYSEAIAEYQLTIKLGGRDEAQIRLAATYAKMGEREQALGILRRVRNEGGYVSYSLLAILYAALGESEEAFASLEKAYTEHDPRLQILKVDQGYDSLRSDPRFGDLMKRIGLPQ